MHILSCLSFCCPYRYFLGVVLESPSTFRCIIPTGKDGWNTAYVLLRGVPRYMRLCVLVSRASFEVWLAERAAISPPNLITDVFMPAPGLGGFREGHLHGWARPQRV
ncbi:hypothetical protein VN97_g9531 [Penicillium thymicola]|uniref:Uncharacterized protein n=1 Tax=Penicillium thymicola TaxID=293382 RepID=A0AAI9TAP4_PENTH|nr:hypothetical protein VN97_g9531 [Penicillium thymicola]